MDQPLWMPNPVYHYMEDLRAKHGRYRASTALSQDVINDLVLEREVGEL